MCKLYVVAVPIGNLEEITLLGKRILSTTKIIFCEDTRVTKKLLVLLNIWNDQQLFKLNQFNEKKSVEFVLEKLENEDCVLVSDAGYPIISDPGYFLISDLRKKGVDIQVVNGPCAFIHAIVTSGIDSRRIFFASFLTKKYLQRKKELINFKNILKEATVIYYETKNFLLFGLEILKEVYGDIKIGIGRELSKMNETFYYDHISKIQEEIVVKGEFVVIIPRDSCSSSESIDQKKLKDDLNVCEDMEEIINLVRNRVKNFSNKKSTFILEDKTCLRDICKEFSELTGSKYSTKDIYKCYVQRYREEK